MAGERTAGRSARELFADLRAHKLVSQDQLAALETAASRLSRAKTLPLHLQVLAGVAAVIAAVCLVAFLVEANVIPGVFTVFDRPGSVDLSIVYSNFLWGAVFMAGAVFLASLTGDGAATLKSSFIQQTALCFMGTGKFLIVLGFQQWFAIEDGWGVALAILLVSLAAYPFYHSPVDRFLSLLALLVTVLINLQIAHFEAGIREIVLNAFFIAQLGAAAFLLASGKVKRSDMPLVYALVFSLCGVVMFFALRATIATLDPTLLNLNPVVVNASLATCLLALIGWLAGGVAKVAESEPLILATIGAVVLALFSAPGVTLAIILMTLGYSRHERLLLTLGGLLLTAFVFLYYYNLDISLLVKSGILIVSGSILLAGWGYTHFRGLDRERT